MISLLILAITLPQITTELAGEGIIQTVHGQTWNGQIDGIEDGRLRMRQQKGDGTAWLLWRRDEVLELKLPGRNLRGPLMELLQSSSPGNSALGLKGLDLYWQSRLPYLDWLTMDELMFLVAMTPAYLQQGRLWEAVALGQQLENILQGRAPEAEEELQRLMLEGLFRFGFTKTAEQRAMSYQQKQIGFCGYALPWYILALEAAQRKAYEEALDLLWFPLLLRREPNPQWIQECLILAYTIADQLKDTVLLRELEQLSALPEHIKSHQ